MSPGTCVDSSHAVANTTHRSATSRVRHTSNAGVGSHSSSTSPLVASSPAAQTVSMTSAACASSTSSNCAAARRSRTPSPPERSTPGASTAQRSSRRRDVSHELVCGSRSRVGRPPPGRDGATRRLVRRSRLRGAGARHAGALPAHAVTRPCRGQAARSTPRASSHSTGVFADSAVTVRSAFCTRPVGFAQVERVEHLAGICRGGRR